MKFASPALDAVTRHDPAPDTVSTPALTAQPDAVPSETVYETAPVPDPPLVVKVNPDPNVPLFDVSARAA